MACSQVSKAWHAHITHHEPLWQVLGHRDYPDTVEKRVLCKDAAEPELFTIFPQEILKLVSSYLAND